MFSKPQTEDRNDNGFVNKNGETVMTLNNRIRKNNRIKTFAVAIAAVAITGVMTLTGGSAQASFQAFDASVEDPTSVQVGESSNGVVWDRLPADDHDAEIVMGLRSTEIVEATRTLVIALPYQGDETDEPGPIKAFAYHGDENDDVRSLKAFAYLGDNSEVDQPQGKTQTGALVGILPGDDHDAAFVMANNGSIRERGVIVARSYQGDDMDTEFNLTSTPVTVIAQPLPADDHDAEIVMGLRTTEVGRTLVLALPYWGDETDEPGPIKAFAYHGDENDDSGQVEAIVGLGYQGDESDNETALV